MKAHDPSAPADAPLSADVMRHYSLTLGQELDTLSNDYLYRAVVLAIRERLVARWKRSHARRQASGQRQVAYLSLEFLMGRALTNAVYALDIGEALRDFLLPLGVELEALADAEHDAGLGNGGLGRLAACFLDSCATLDLPVTGYGLRYEYGMFRQSIEDGRQVEYPDSWLRDGNPWEIERAEDTRCVHFAGRTVQHRDAGGRLRVEWIETSDVLAVPYDLLIPGHNSETVNRLRLWKAAATDAFNLNEFHAGGYAEAVEAKNQAEKITMVLYPNDVTESGKELRLRQQYLLASASLQDVVDRWVARHGHDFSAFGRTHVFQLNDTHPSCAVPELMRILLDEHGLGWEEAWRITTSCMAYTNHTLLPEALERWPVRLFRELLPRLIEIIFEINARFLQEVAARWPGDKEALARMSLIEEGEEPQVRMAYLAIVGSFSVNGVAALHSRLLREGLFKDFHALWPARFNNKTNGVTPRRWIEQANPALANLITSAIGARWRSDLEALRELEPFADDAGFRDAWREVKRANKERLSARLVDRAGTAFDPERLLDVQVKRIHEYKRQLLNILHVIHLYDRIQRGDGEEILPRTVLIGGKAAPGYQQARLIIHFINCVAQVLSRDARVAKKLRVLFVPNYDVTAMELICPATELSEQISTAGKEASGTGNMKFMMNGAITLGTLDGANIEIRDHVGAERFFAFGLTADEVAALEGHYDPHALIGADEDLARVMALIDSDHFSLFAPGGFAAIADSIRSPADPWAVAADFRSYVDAQQGVERVWRDAEHWQRMSIANTAASGWFSSDRTIREYARDIWRIAPPDRAKG